MTNIKVRLVVVAVACLALIGALAPVSRESQATTTYGTNSTEDGNQGANVLITDAGYMVAVG